MPEPQTHRIYTDRSRKITADRCKRLRWWEYHAGSKRVGLSPVRKSIHLVIGGAVHAGLETLLRDGQVLINRNLGYSVEECSKITAWREVENAAVAAALIDLATSTRFGVELDMNEQAGTQQAQLAAAGVQIDFSGADGMVSDVTASSIPQADSPIMIEFGQFEGMAPVTFGEQLTASVVAEGGKADVDWSKPIYGEKSTDAVTAMAPNDLSASVAGIDISANQIANQQAATGIDSYLKAELAALVEAMVRAYARRRLRPLLEQFEVLEVEREGMWRLAGYVELPCSACKGRGENVWFGGRALGSGRHISVCSKCNGAQIESIELWFTSRLDALLLERSTNSLYLQSYKTTGSWDRRKAAEAEIDMQGLSEVVDVENRLSEAWQLVQERNNLLQELSKIPHDEADMEGEKNVRKPPIRNHIANIHRRSKELADKRTLNWLELLPSPPRILGVRYEYLLKGQRRQDDKDPQLPGRYVADTPLIRAYSQVGITGDDRRWAANYSYYTLAGQKKNIDYRSWHKTPVWKFMPIERWIDLLDEGKIQPDTYNKAGLPVDVLAEQFIAPIHVYRNEDDMRDMLEQLEASEVGIVQDVAAVEAVKNDPQQYRSELNKRFPQNRNSCIYPGKCFAFQICYGSADMRQNPEQSELYMIRVANHPVEDQR